MVFWVFMLVANLLIPASMIIIGIIWKKKPPKKINLFIGYRSKRSMKNKEIWLFAQQFIRKKWLNLGIILAVLVAIIMVTMIEQTANYIGTMSLVIIACEIGTMAVSVAMTESALKEHFDENGKRIR